jgi:hypothetical protein
MNENLKNILAGIPLGDVLSSTLRLKGSVPLFEAYWAPQLPLEDIDPYLLTPDQILETIDRLGLYNDPVFKDRLAAIEGVSLL